MWWGGEGREGVGLLSVDLPPGVTVLALARARQKSISSGQSPPADIVVREETSDGEYGPGQLQTGPQRCIYGVSYYLITLKPLCFLEPTRRNSAFRDVTLAD